MAELNAQQQQAVKEHPKAPMVLMDPSTQFCYVLIPAETFDRILALLTDDEFRVDEAYPLMDNVAKAGGWSDTVMLPCCDAAAFVLPAGAASLGGSAPAAGAGPDSASKWTVGPGSGPALGTAISVAACGGAHTPQVPPALQCAHRLPCNSMSR